MTILNSQEFKYFSYYDRIKDQVTETWRPLIRNAIKKVKADPKTYGTLEIRYYTTELEIVLNSKGSIISTSSLENSGQELFDYVATQAFRKAAPYANPPKELVKDGRFTLRWNFTIRVEASGWVEHGGGQI